MEFFAPGVHFCPLEFAAFDGEEAVAVGFDLHGDAAFAQGGRAGEEEAQEVHSVFPADFAVVAQVLLDLLELAEGVAVEGLKDHLGKEAVAQVQEFLAQGGDLFHEGRVEAFEDVRVRLQRHDEEFLEFPKAGLGGVVLKLFGRAVEGPLQIGGREVNAADVGVGACRIQTVGAGADDAAVDDEGVEAEVRAGGGGRLPFCRNWQGLDPDTRRVGDRRSEAVFEVFEDFELVTGEGGFEAVGEADEVVAFGAGRGAGDDADSAARVDQGSGGAAHFGKCHDLGAGKEFCDAPLHVGTGIAEAERMSEGENRGRGCDRRRVRLSITHKFARSVIKRCVTLGRTVADLLDLPPKEWTRRGGK